MVGVVIGHDQDRAQVGLVGLAGRDRLSQIESGVRDELLQPLAIGPDARDALVPCGNGCPSVSSRGAHVGLWPRTHPEHTVSDGSLALFLLEPVQESRVDGFGPVHAEVGRDRIKAAEQISAQENLHGDSVWMLWHVAALADGPTIHPEVAVPPRMYWIA